MGRFIFVSVVVIVLLEVQAFEEVRVAIFPFHHGIDRTGYSTPPNRDVPWVACVESFVHLVVAPVLVSLEEIGLSVATPHKHGVESFKR